MMKIRALSICVLATLLGSGCGVCGEYQLIEASSPAKKYVATVFRRGCGATTGFLYHVNLKSSAATFSPDYRGVIEEGRIFLTREGKISLGWKDDATLQVICDGCPKDRKPTMEKSWNGVTMSFELR